MADEPTTEPHADFWAAREAHCNRVKDKLAAVQEEILAGYDEGLFKDGITTRLENVRLAVEHHIAMLSAPSQPGVPTPPIPLTPSV